MNPVGTSNQLAILGKALGYSQGGAPSNVLGYQQSAPAAAAPAQSAPAAAAPDPYSQWGGQSNYNNLVNAFNTQKSNIYGTANEAVGNAAIGINSSILDLVDALKTGQTKINSQAVQNELAKRQGTSDILSSVGNSIRSSGIMLGNRNAGNSSAAAELAKAYGAFGRNQLSKVGNQYEQGNEAIKQSQADLEMQRAAGVRHIGENKAQVVNNIVAEARNKLAALDGQIAGANLPNRINIEQEKEAIKAQALASLQQYDQMLSSQTSAIAPTSLQARQTEASRLASAGAAPDTAFNYTTQAPAQLQNTGPFASSLPIFLAPSKKQQQ